MPIGTLAHSKEGRINETEKRKEMSELILKYGQCILCGKPKLHSTHSC